MARLRIKRGPSIAALSLWVLERMVRGPEGNFHPRTFEFYVVGPDPKFPNYVDRINLGFAQIKPEDGSEPRWFIDGFIVSTRPLFKGKKFHAYYDFNKREGWVDISD